jgi:trimethylamine:corrinoid methyltransferase-like protein
VDHANATGLRHGQEVLVATTGEQWLDAINQLCGKPEAWQRANTVYKRALSEYEEPALEPERREELDSFVERRIREGGAPTDF